MVTIRRCSSRSEVTTPVGDRSWVRLFGFQRAARGWRDRCAGVFLYISVALRGEGGFGATFLGGGVLAEGLAGEIFLAEGFLGRRVGRVGRCPAR
jgi:hypothetical protein